MEKLLAYCEWGGSKQVKPIAQQSGIALITALFIFALVTIAAVAMADRQSLDIRRTGNLLHYDQAYMFALGLEQFAATVLLEGDDDLEVDHPSEPFLTTPVAQEVEGGNISGFIRDATARFPINNLVDANGARQAVYVNAFQRLVDYMTSGDQCGDQGGFNPDLANVVADWIDRNEQVEAGGAEDMEYLNRDRPHRAANQAMASISELRALHNIIAEEYNCIVGDGQNPPIVNAIKNHEVTINVNTAPPEVLQSIHNRIDDTVLQRLLEGRADEPYRRTNDFVDTIIRELNFESTPDGQREERETREAINQIRLSVGSQYFEVTGVAQIGNIEVTLLSLLRREGNRVTTVQRSIGVF